MKHITTWKIKGRGDFAKSGSFLVPLLLHELVTGKPELMQKQGHEEETGLCKITPAFNLPSRYVLHTVGPIIYTSVGPREKILLANCYKNCLETASQNQLESVAFCCISTGVFRFPAELAAQIAVETVEKWLAENPDSSVKKIVFNVFGNKDLEIYKKVLGQK